MEEETVEFIDILIEKEKAYLFDFGGGSKEWLPLSQITID